MALHLDLLLELREKAQIRNLAAKQRAARKYNTNLHPRPFVVGDLVWRMASSARKKDGKFSANWDDPYRIREDAGGGAYRLEQLSGEEIPNTWNISHLKFYFNCMCIVINTCNPGCTLFPHLVFLRRVLAKEVLTRHPYSINKKKGSPLYDSLCVLSLA